MTVNLTDLLRSINKAIGAVVGGGVIALLVGLHVVPAGVGNTILSVLGAAAAVLGAFLAPSNKPLAVNSDLPPQEVSGKDDGAFNLDGLDEEAEQAISGGASSKWTDDDRPRPN